MATMDIHVIRSVLQHCVFAGCCVVSAGIVLFLLARAMRRYVSASAKRLGWGTAAALLSFAVWTVFAGTPTNGDKTRYGIRMQPSSALGSVLLGSAGLGTPSLGAASSGTALSSVAPVRLMSSPSASSLSSAAPVRPMSAPSEDPAEVWGIAAEDLPSVRAPADSDYAAGFALTRIGTGESFDFAPPEGAEVYEPWTRFGAARHWFRLGNGEPGTGNGERGFAFPFGTNEVDALTVFSDGVLRPRTKDVGAFLAPLYANLCLVPAYWWGRLEDTSASPSRFWSARTSSGEVLLTWQNALFGRNPFKPVSFQAELSADGSVEFRYDLSRLDASDLTNLVVGVGSGDSGRVFTELQPGMTSLKWRRLDPTRADDPDPDGDGITTDDEIVRYHTDPYSADTDRDGLSDGAELAAGLDPLDAHTLRADMPDGMAAVIGDLDPFSCPDGSTNTVWEHVFYTGTTNAPFAYPVADGSTAVLEVTASGTGSGELVVGDKVVPLVPRPRPRLLMGANGASDPTATTLRVPIFKGTVQRCFLRIPESLEVAITASDFVYGQRPTFLHPCGWFAFPNTEASHPCIHDLNARQVAVSLDPGFAAEGLTCTWNGSSSVEVEHRPPLAAELTGHFPRSSTTPVTYTLSHPDYLFGATTYTQTARFCPQLDDEEDDELYEREQRDAVYTEDDHWCCSWGDCCDGDGDCSCGCNHCSLCGGGDSPADMDENCPVHHVAYEQCASLHDADYVAAKQLEEYPDVLKIRDRLVFDRIDLPCPEGECHCCPCPDHHTNHVSLAYRSYRLRVVDDSGDDFSNSDRPCTVLVTGVRPSMSVGDAHLAFATNGVVFSTYDETVLGMEIVKSSGPSLDTYNSLNRALGLPMTVNTNLFRAVQLGLKTNVRLPFGNVRLSLEETEGQFAVWRYDYRSGEYLKLLDSDGRSVINLPVDRWRRLVGSASDSSSPETPIYITSSHKGSTTLRFGYWGVSDGQLVEDWDEQVVTSVNPLLLPDYNRDGVIDATDVDRWLDGRWLYFWSNDDTWRGDDAFAGYSSGVHPAAYELPKNRDDMIVNGRNDLVNLCPFAVDVFDFRRQWGSDVYFEFQTADPGGVRFTAATTEWSEVGDMVKTDQSTVYGEALHAAALRTTVRLDGGAESGYVLPSSLIGLGEDGAGIIAAEFASPGPRSLRIVIRKSGSGEMLFSSGVDMHVLDVHDMYRWVNLFGACGEQTGSKFANRRYVSWPDSEHADANVVFVHGYNVHETEAWDWSQAMFKRLWWSGMDAGFTAVLWKGNYSQAWIPKIPGLKDDNSYATLNYHQNVLNAFRTAGAFKTAMDGLPGAKKYYIAHSLGNMLVSAAKQDHGLEYEKYMMLNAAVPIEAYDPGGVTVESKLAQTPPEWRAYPDRVRATHWYELFPEGDARRTLTWKNRFKDVDDTVNFYSSRDEVVANGDGDGKVLLSRKYAWYNQERKRGKLLVSASPQAGWVFSSNYRVTYASGYSPVGGTIYSSRPYNATEAAAISADDLKVNPFFLDFHDEEIYGDGGNTFVRDNPYIRWYALSHGIPAESFAAGANPVPKWDVVVSDVDGKAKKKIARNVDMATACNPEGEEADPVDWIHSYFIQRPLHDTKKLYEKLTEIINGKPIGGEK